MPSPRSLAYPFVVRRGFNISRRRPLAHPRHGILNEPWLPRPSLGPLPTTYFSPTQPHRVIEGLDGDPRNDRHKPPDERVLKLGKSKSGLTYYSHPSRLTTSIPTALRTLSPLLPTILYNTLPAEILAPCVNLHLFPSTHPHLPIVKGRTLYRAALWTVPVAWSSVPLVGNVKLQILSERIIRAGTMLDPEHGEHHDCGDERLVVRWRTEPRTDSRPFHETRAPSKPRATGAQQPAGPAPNSTAQAQTQEQAPAQQSHLSKSSAKNGTNRGLSVLLGGEEPIFKLSKEEQFTGLFVFSFDEEGRILSHTIEHADESHGWDRTPKFVTLTDWLIGKARGSLDPAPNPELAMGCCQGYEVPENPQSRQR